MEIQISRRASKDAQPVWTARLLVPKPLGSMSAILEAHVDAAFPHLDALGSHVTGTARPVHGLGPRLLDFGLHLWLSTRGASSKIPSRIPPCAHLPDH